MTSKLKYYHQELILPTHLHQKFFSGFFPSDFPSNVVCVCVCVIYISLPLDECLDSGGDYVES